MSRRSDRDEFDDDLGEWSDVVHHKNRKQGDGGRSKRSTMRDKESGARKPNSPRRNTNKHSDHF
ncbi:hypothetical protein [Sedimenticola selenatireducens]|uniref:hypothetical protein n=1 Tax=Sedimenticola selenatireducens TaxID=191960 RepID=UPI0004B723C0|nr:hypothetical protein [Sedimenticola selenatireducens]